MNDEIWRYDSRDSAYVRRTVEVWGMFDADGREDDEHGKWRKRTPAEFAAAIVEAADGLTDAEVEVGENYGSGVVLVYGDRPTLGAEKADYDERERRVWGRAKTTYEAGRAKFEANGGSVL